MKDTRRCGIDAKFIEWAKDYVLSVYGEGSAKIEHRICFEEVGGEYPLQNDYLEVQVLPYGEWTLKDEPKEWLFLVSKELIELFTLNYPNAIELHFGGNLDSNYKLYSIATSYYENTKTD